MSRAPHNILKCVIRSRHSLGSVFPKLATVTGQIINMILIMLISVLSSNLLIRYPFCDSLLVFGNFCVFTKFTRIHEWSYLYFFKFSLFTFYSIFLYRILVFFSIWFSLPSYGSTHIFRVCEKPRFGWGISHITYCKYFHFSFTLRLSFFSSYSPL